MRSFSNETPETDGTNVPRETLPDGDADLRQHLLNGVTALPGDEGSLQSNTENNQRVLDLLRPHLENVNPIFNEMMLNEWFDKLYEISELPKPYDYHSCRENFKIALSVAAGIAASILYYLGGDKDGVEYIIGGIAVNLFQTIFFTKETIDFVDEIKSQKQLAAISLFLGIFSTVVTTIATYQFSVEKNGVALAVILSLLNAGGNLPQNLYGMFASIRRVLDGYHDNPSARSHLLNELRAIVANHDILKNSIGPDRSLLNKALNQIAGAAIGLFLTTSLVGYFRSSADGIAKITKSTMAGLVLGLLTNLPNMCISLFISGKNLAEKMVNNVIDWSTFLFKEIAGLPVAELTPRERYLICAKIATALSFGVLANYSAATSVHLYKDSPPLPYIPSNAQLDAFIEFAVDIGARIFNGVMAVMAADVGIDFVYKAYVTTPSNDEIKIRMEEIVKTILTKDIKVIEEIAANAGWQRAQVIPARHSFLSNWRRTSTQPSVPPAGYQALPGETLDLPPAPVHR